MFPRFAPLALALTLLAASPALAHSDARLMVRPWQDKSQFEFDVALLLFAEADTDNGAATTDMTIVDAEGRWRLNPQQRGSFAIGFDVTYIDMANDDPALPDSLVDHAVSVGIGVGQLHGWEITASVGVGYAGDAPYSDGDAVYFRLDLVGIYQYRQDVTIYLALNFNGNRSIFPDLPLPFAQWQQRLNDKFSFAIGFPVNSFTWQPTPRLTITASYIIPVTVDGRIRYELTDAVAVFGAFNNRFDAFRVDGQPDHHRTFLDQSLIEGGVAWSPNTQISLIAAVGYRLDGKFETGFDVRDTTTIADLSDEVFGRVEAVIVF